MYQSDSFEANKRFYADKHFPYGISRSGEFNRQQAKLLEEHGEAYQALHSGERSPINDEERDFVAVCKGEKPAQTEHEVAWIRFCEKTQKKRVFTPAFYGKPELDEDDYVPLEDESVDEPIE